MATELVVIGQGRLVDQCSVTDFVAKYGDHFVQVQSPMAARLTELLTQAGAQVVKVDDARFQVRGPTCAQVGDLAGSQGIVLHELSTQTGSLEDAFLKATAEVHDYRAGAL